jgi:pimeloyl-ACP methyl ester carboxylesterase
MTNYFYDEHHVRYEWVGTQDGSYNWLFLPGGPGANSSYLYSLTNHLNLPGNTWMIDLPGNGDNTNGLADHYDFDQWYDLFIPMIKKFANPVLVAHSWGGMFSLLFPELEEYLQGFVILHASPFWRVELAADFGKQFHLPDLTAEMYEFIHNPSPTTFKAALNACMPYYFPPKSLAEGRALFAKIPFRFQPALWWQRKVAESNFAAKWIPQKVPTLIVGAEYDCMCPFFLFQNDTRFMRNNIELLQISDAGHMSWVENPIELTRGFTRFYTKLNRHT